MADEIVWKLASKALEVLGKEAIRKAASWWGARDDLDKLGETMRAIQARVRDAERRQEEESSDLIKLWLQRLRLVLYRADDLFDEVLTLDLLKQQQRMEKSMLCKVGILFTMSGPLCYNIKLASEIKSIRKELDDIKSDMDRLKLNVLPPQELSMAPLLEDRETSSVLKETVTGRENDENNIIEMLLDPKYDGEEITVLPIVGFGGLGKTTLAQLVFNHERVQKHFDLKKWAYVPEKNNLRVIKGKIFHAFTHENHQNRTLEDIEQGIKKSIASKKYLLVLDDLWTDEGADITKLLSLLKGGKHGSKVIVTTRLNAVAQHFGPIKAAYKLGTLSEDKSWELFEKLAFGPGQENNRSEFSKIGQDIVKLCGNVPLAIEVVGGSLRSKHTQEEWLRVKSDLSKAQSAETHNIMTTLKISYDYLQPVSKLCFAYCSLFPKGYEFHKDELVHLWMAQGYVEPDNGDQYFGDLVARNLFQATKNHLGVDEYKMHDLLHDLAQAAAGDDESMVLGNERPDQIYNRLVHVNLNGSKSPPSMKNANRLRSLLNFDSKADDKFLLKFHSLRVLDMECSAQNKKLLDSIGRLIHLRYLELRCDYAIYLPDSITRLVNLQTLYLVSCDELKELPRDFGKLVNLRHLLLPYSLSDLPPGFEKLTSLQELNRFIVGKGYGIDSLGTWSYRGMLVIEFCRWRRNAIEEVKSTNLENNHQLTSLTLHLDFGEEEFTPVATVSEMHDMLRYLKLPPNLEELKVRNYKGYEMPMRWLDGLSQLVSVDISGCTECKVVPKLSGLPHLKSVELDSLGELEYVENEDEDNIRVGTASATHNNPSLKRLVLKKCYKLKGWRRASKDEGERRQLVFPCLLELVVEECPMLMSMPLAPKLESLAVSKINWKMVESSKVRANDDNEEEAAASSSSPPPPPPPPPSSSSSTLSTSLKDLRIRDVKSSSGGWQGLRSLRELTLRRIPKMKVLPRGMGCIKTLEELRVIDMENLTEIPEEIGNLSLLHLLRIERCPNVKSLPPSIMGLPMLQTLYIWKMDNLAELPAGEIDNCNGNLPLLQHLEIENCPKMTSLPTLIQGLTSLLRLWILGCPDLGKKNTPGGEDWHLIQHIPNLIIFDGSKVYRREDGKKV